MTTATLCFDDNPPPRTARKLARFLSPKPLFNLHAKTSPKRTQVEDYIFEQFQTAHHASVKDFMPLLFSIECNGRISATAGVRPGCQQDFFLEQYLDDKVQHLISNIAGENIGREKVAEIGNMVATRRGSSQLLFLIFCAVLQHSKHEWIVFTATPTVLKGIAQLGFQLHKLGDADPNAVVKSNTNDWGTYYNSKPQVVAGNLADAMTLMTKRKIYSSLISLFKNRIGELAEVVNNS